MAKTKCEVRNGRLVVTGDLSTDGDTSFDGACQQLLAAPSLELVADLSKVNYMSSTYVGLLAELALNAKGKGKRLKLVALPRTAALLREAGLGQAADIEAARK